MQKTYYSTLHKLLVITTCEVSYTIPLIRTQLYPLVPPVIEVRASRTTVGLLDDLTLSCVVLNAAVPMPQNYTWVYTDSNTTLAMESNSSTITIAPFKDGAGTYRCEVFTLAGLGESNITIEVEGIHVILPGTL